MAEFAPMRFAAAAVTLALAAPLLAQEPPPSPCTSRERMNLYTNYYSSRSSSDPETQKYAYEVAKEYLEKYAADCSDQYTESVKKFIAAYEDATNRYTLTRFAFGANADFAKAFETGRKILAVAPDDPQALLALAHAGFTALSKKDDSYAAEALADAKKAIEQIEAGKAPANWNPYKSREDALSLLYFYAGNLAFAAHDPAGAVPLLIKAASSEGAAKKDPSTYGKLAAAYQASQLTTMQTDYNAKFGGKPETPEGKHALDELNQVLDRILDGYARAVNLSGDNPRYAQAKAAWLEALKTIYKFRVNDAMTGLDEYVANATTRPLPEPFVSKPYVPEPTQSKRR